MNICYSANTSEKLEPLNEMWKKCIKIIAFSHDRNCHIKPWASRPQASGPLSTGGSNLVPWPPEGSPGPRCHRSIPSRSRYMRGEGENESQPGAGPIYRVATQRNWQVNPEHIQHFMPSLICAAVYRSVTTVSGEFEDQHMMNPSTHCLFFPTWNFGHQVKVRNASSETPTFWK